MDIGGAKPFIDDSNLGRVYLYPISTDNVSKEFNFFLLKLTLGEFYLVVVRLD